MKDIKVLLADDHSIVRTGCEAILSKAEGITVIAHATNGREAVDSYIDLKPDVVVLDLVMPGGFDAAEGLEVAKMNGGLEALRRIMAFDNQARILVLTGKEGSAFPNHAFQAGALGFMTKSDVDGELSQAIRDIVQGRQYVADSVRKIMNVESSDDLVSTLSKREFQIFSLLAEGQKVSAIAEQTFTSPKTVHAHRAKILRKLKVKGTSDLVHLAIRAGIIDA